jgi:cytochrome c biogenesis protein CcdA
MELWAVLLPILLTDAVNPVLFAFLVYAAGSDRPIGNSSAMLLGHTAAYFVAGVVLALSLEKIALYFSVPRAIDFIVGAVIGLVLIGLALKTRNDPGKRPQEDSPAFTPLSAFGFGAVINFIGIPFAVPYFAAIDQIMKADLTAAEVLVMLLAYNLAYALPFAVVPVLSAVMGERARPLLERVNAYLDRISAVILPLLLGLVGLALVVDALNYFLTGSGLY